MYLISHYFTGPDQDKESVSRVASPVVRQAPQQ